MSDQDQQIAAWEQERPRGFLEHAVKATSQYDAQYRSMAAEILALRQVRAEGGQVNMGPKGETARRGQIAERFGSYTAAARNARRAYESGAAEREGAEHEQYIDCAHAQSVREQILNEVFATLDFDLFVGDQRVSALLPPAPVGAAAESANLWCCESCGAYVEPDPMTPQGRGHQVRNTDGTPGYCGPVTRRAAAEETGDPA